MLAAVDAIMLQLTSSLHSFGQGFYISFTITLPSPCAPSSLIDFSDIKGLSESGWIAYDYEAQLRISAAVTRFLPPTKPPLDWLSGYASQSQCTWSVTVPYDSTVRIELEYLDTMQPDGLHPDRIQVWNGNSTDRSAVPIASWSGNVKADQITFVAGRYQRISRLYLLFRCK